jgi:hypothetical protein
MKLLLIQLCFIFWASMGFGQGICGVFDRTQCITLLPEHATEAAKLKARAAQLDDSLKLMASEYQRYLMNSGPHGRLLDSLDIMRIAEDIRSLERGIEEYQRFAQQELVQLEKTSMERLSGILMAHLRSYCEGNNLNLMVERDALFYGPECVDHTAGFIEFLGRRR